MLEYPFGLLLPYYVLDGLVYYLIFKWCLVPSTLSLYNRTILYIWQLLCHKD